MISALVLGVVIGAVCNSRGIDTSTIKPLVDMARTPCNIIGDVAIALVVDKSEKKKEQNNNEIHSGK